jgi:predicted nucleic acid-binding protein
MQAFPDQTLSFTDCTSFALMERIGVHEAFAFDSHFLVYRFGSRRDRVFQRWPT